MTPCPVSPRESLSWDSATLFKRADEACREVFGKSVYLRGLIEATNICKRDCLYCGIRRSNAAIARYRLSDDEIVNAVVAGTAIGLKSFVIQGGEDPEFSAERLARLVERIRTVAPEAAITLSFGTMPRRDYAMLRSAGADRYLMRFETSDEKLHLALRGSSLASRLKAIEDLRSLDFEVGSGFMTGLPGTDEAQLVKDVELAARLQLDMAGIGPFIPHPETPLAKEKGQGLEFTQRAVAALRLALPLANLPATTAAGSVAPDGRERVLEAGANVLMPNIGPVAQKKDYELYPGKICLDEDGAKCIGCLALRVASTGKRLDFARGDSPSVLQRRQSSLSEEVSA